MLFILPLKMAVLKSLLTLLMRNKNYNVVFKRCEKHFSVRTPLQSAYESDGKSVIHILNSEKNAPLMINAYSMFGFRLNNGLFVVGPVALFPSSILSWNVKDDMDINEKSLSLFLHLAPKLDILVIGLSDARNHKLLFDTTKSVHELTKHYKRGEKMNIEVLPTEKAVTTFNFLNSDGFFVGAALIPPTFYTPTVDDEYRKQYLTQKKEKGDFLIENK